MKRHLLFLSLMGSSMALYAQPLATVTGLKLFEHHSSSINNNAPFGSGANPTQSGYDFVNRVYYNSFNLSTFGPYTNGEESNIDMVEHNSVYGNQGNFGFTSAVSSIWGGDIKGNNTTVWMEAPASFNYTSATNVSNILSVFNATMATKAIAEVKENTVYLGRIRNSNLYVAMRCYNLKNATAPGGVKDVSFEFEYKYGTFAPTGIDEIQANEVMSVYPNPAVNEVMVKNIFQKKITAKVVSALGQEIRSFSLNKDAIQSIDISNISSGIYYIICIADGNSYTQKFIKN